MLNIDLNWLLSIDIKMFLLFKMYHGTTPWYSRIKICGQSKDKSRILTIFGFASLTWRGCGGPPGCRTGGSPGTWCSHCSTAFYKKKKKIMQDNLLLYCLSKKSWPLSYSKLLYDILALYVQEVLTQFVYIAYHIKWVGSSWTDRMSGILSVSLFLLNMKI